MPTTKPAPVPFRPCCRLRCAGQLKEVLRWWGGEREDGGAKPRAPHIVGPLGKLACAPQNKAQWTKAVLDKAEPRNSHQPGNKLWDQLRRTMPPAARVLLQELEGAGEGAAGAV